jgi:acetylornithine aminotransferase
MLECIQGEGGVWPHSDAYIKEVRRITLERKIALIIDEVQTGFYRTGQLPFSYAQWGIIPDVVALAKGMANGFPIGAVCARDGFGELMCAGEHGSTFGGNPLAIAAATATISILNSKELQQNVEKTGEYLRSQLSHLPKVKDVRGRGLIVGVSLECEQAHAVVNAVLSRGFVINATGASDLRFLPPLICSKADVDQLLVVLEDVLKGL